MDENTQGAKIRAKKGATLPPGLILLAACLNLLAVIFLGDTISVGSQVIPTNNWEKCLALKHAYSDKFPFLKIKSYVLRIRISMLDTYGNSFLHSNFC